jgi:hypothetical protein
VRETTHIGQDAFALDAEASMATDEADFLSQAVVAVGKDDILVNNAVVRFVPFINVAGGTRVRQALQDRFRRCRKRLSG